MLKKEKFGFHGTLLSFTRGAINLFLSLKIHFMMQVVNTGSKRTSGQIYLQFIAEYWVGDG